MDFSKIKVTNNEIIVDKYINIDTNVEHNLLIYRYTINNIANYNIVIGEVLDNQNEIKKFIKENINYRLSNSLLLFVYSSIKKAQDKKLFDCINFSKEGYDLLFSNNIDIKQNLYNKLKEIIIDPTTKKFSSYDIDAFHNLEYYENLENEKSKVLKKAVNI